MNEWVKKSIFGWQNVVIRTHAAGNTFVIHVDRFIIFGLLLKQNELAVVSSVES